ncbi:MAG: polyribonucleotide nucleotidyltransferase [Bacilli bacterium]|nr:polyribonucleotide nucleotidyltransferase [Bacilli bacterium]MDD3896189.1 polyribonucleotide nucleotidyltransferase [Bacilli bacterium]MDD4408041.1 polyribonucleotide nucleotidyltransferase [Bacilli bacterium]
MNKKEFSFNFLGRNIIVEVGELAKQADGAALVRYGDTVVLSATVMNDNISNSDFFPLTIVYNEKLYSVGKIPGGFIKREGRASDNATLAARLIDRPIRPMFDENFRNEVQVINTILSVDPNNTPEMTALFASSLALGISKIPFDGPIAGVVVGKIGKKYLINPTSEELEDSELTVTVAGTKNDICMIEAGSKEISEEDMLEALMFGHKYIKELCLFQEEIIEVVGKEKVEIIIPDTNKTLEKEIYDYAEKNMLSAVQIKNKLDSYEKIEEVKLDAINYFTEKYEDEISEKYVKKIMDNIEASVVRDLIINKKIRPDGRKLDEIRDLSAGIDLLPRTHGSALFTRGQTQSLSTTTLGAIGEHQILDGLGIEDTKRFMLHYNFPQFSVGETGRYGSPGRREIGHGALGEKALLQVIPSEEEFPYTIRVVSEILESNGSSSQASICAGCLSLMAAGVPIKAPVAGIAMGLITKGKKYTILTDIAGLEDHMGDMDFKVAGTKNGITALQMDIKIKGVTKSILKEALQEAKKARLKILKVMADIITEPRKELSAYAPKIKIININPDKIKDVIGRGGEMITKIILEASNVNSVSHKDAVKVDLEDDGRVIIYHTDYEVINKTVEMIENIIKEVVTGELYTGTVVKVEDFGCFVKLWEGTEGLIHVSHLAHERVNKPSDIVKVGDEIIVKSLGYDNRGRLNLSRKEALPKPDKKQN